MEKVKTAVRRAKYKKVMPEVEEEIIDLRLSKRFGCNRIKFRLRRIIGLSLSTRTIYKILKRHGLNILKCNANTRTYKRFAMRHPNDMVQIDILGPFYLSNSRERNYFISCLDDCSRKVASKWCERKRTINVLDVLEEWTNIIWNVSTNISIDCTTAIIASRKVSPMWVTKIVTYVCNPCELF